MKKKTILTSWSILKFFICVSVWKYSHSHILGILWTYVCVCVHLDTLIISSFTIFENNNKMLQRTASTSVGVNIINECLIWIYYIRACVHMCMHKNRRRKKETEKKNSEIIFQSINSYYYYFIFIHIRKKS